MARKIIVLLFIMLLSVQIYSKDKDKDKDIKNKAGKTSVEKIGDQVYYEQVLEDFEKTKYTNENISFIFTRNQKADVSMRTSYPAPIRNSKKYLGVKCVGKSGDVFTITPTRDLIIDKYCRSISLWIYGKRFSGELSIMLQDANNQNHRLVVGKLNFLGWRKMKVKLTKDIAQEDEFLNQKRFMKLIQFQYRPGNLTRLPRWQYFYIDDISVMVRNKYTDRQSDDW